MRTRDLLVAERRKPEQSSISDMNVEMPRTALTRAPGQESCRTVATPPPHGIRRYSQVAGANARVDSVDDWELGGRGGQVAPDLQERGGRHTAPQRTKGGVCGQPTCAMTHSAPSVRRNVDFPPALGPVTNWRRPPPLPPPLPPLASRVSVKSFAMNRTPSSI